MNALKELSDVENTITELESRLNTFRKRKLMLESIISSINQQRPPGIPTTWEAEYDGIPPHIHIHKWFDPSYHPTLR